MTKPDRPHIDPDAKAVIDAYQKSVREARAEFHRRLYWDFRIPRSVERVLTWLSLALFAAFNVVLTLGLFLAAWQGAIKELRKSGGGSVVLLTANPATFWVQLLLHLVLTAAFWWMFGLAWRRTQGIR